MEIDIHGGLLSLNIPLGHEALHESKFAKRNTGDKDTYQTEAVSNSAKKAF